MMAQKKKPTAAEIERLAESNDRKMALQNARDEKQKLNNPKAHRREYDRNQSYLNPGSRQLIPQEYEKQYQGHVKEQRKIVDASTKYGLGKTAAKKKPTLPTARKK